MRVDGEVNLCQTSPSMWFRDIDGVVHISYDLAEKIKELALPRTKIFVNGKEYILGDSLDLERTRSDERWWFYTDDELHALFLQCIGSEDRYTIDILERKLYWFSVLRERSLQLTQLSFGEDTQPLINISKIST